MTNGTDRQRSGGSNYAVQISDLRGEVGGIKTQLSGLNDAVDKMNSNFSQSINRISEDIHKSRQPQPMVTISLAVAGMSFIAMLAGYLSFNVVGPIRTDVDRVNQTVERMSDNQQTSSEKMADYFQSKIDALQEDKVGQREHNELKGEIQAKIDDLSGRIKKLDDNIVPRGENTEHWNSQEHEVESLGAKIDNVSRTLDAKIDSTNSELAGIYSAKDVFQNIQTRLNAIELRLVQPPSGH